MSLVLLKGFVNDYEILNKYSFTIRNKMTRKPLKDLKHKNYNDYLLKSCNINEENYSRKDIITVPFAIYAPTLY